MYTIIKHKNDSVEALGLFESEDEAHTKLISFADEYGVKERKTWEDKGYENKIIRCYVLGQEDKNQDHVAVDCVSDDTPDAIRYSRALFTIVEIYGN